MPAPTHSLGQIYWIVTSSFGLIAEKIALICKLRWQIEIFYAWWKRHLKVCHIISRSCHDGIIQMLAGLIS